MGFYADEKDRPRRKGVATSLEFWAGVIVVLSCLSIGLGIASWMMG